MTATGILAEQAMLELGAVDTTELLTLLECPVCLDHITPPVKQCIKGHLVCSDCFPRLPHCPTCRSTMSIERNLAMEMVSRLLQFPCRYHPMGCKISASLSKKAEHERNCDYLQLKCPFHGQCSFSGSLNMVTPHLKTEHAVTPVPVQPNGTLFYRAKQFAKRNLWAFIYQWDTNMFRFLVKHIHASSVGRTDNCNLVIAHVQYIGPDSMAAQYAYQISLFDAERRTNGPKFEGVVSSTMKPLESQVSSQVSKDEVFVATTYTAREYTDQFGQLNFIITMRSLKEKEYKKKESSSSSRRHRSTARPANNTSQPGTSTGASTGPSIPISGAAASSVSTAGPSTAGLSTAGPSTAGSSTAGPSSAGSSSAVQSTPSLALPVSASSSASQSSTSSVSEAQAGPSGLQSAALNSLAVAGPSSAASSSSIDQSNNIPVNLTTTSTLSVQGQNNEVTSSPSPSTSTSTSSSLNTSSEASAVQSTSGVISPSTSRTFMDTSEEMVMSTNPQL